MTRSRSAGFTLLEMLVALVIFGLLTAGLAQGTRAGLAMLGIQGRASAGLQDLDAVDRTLRRLIGTVDVGTRLIGPPALRRQRPKHGLHRRPAARRHRLPHPAGRCRAGRRCGASPGAALGAALRPADRPPAGAAPDRAAGRGGPHRGVVLAAFGPGRRWVTQWQSDTLPALVRIRIVFPAGDARRWPDIVAATNVF